MATCPNKNLDEWKSLVASRGENIAYYLWDKYEGEVPVSEYGTTKKGLFNLIIEDVENFNPRNFPNEVKRIIGLIENKLKIKTRAFMSANIPSYTNKKEYLDSVFKSLLENIGLPSEINTFTELRRQLNSGEVEQYVRSQYDFYKRELQQEFDNRKPTPSITTLENFLKDPTIYDRYDDEQQTFVRSAFPVLFGDLGRYKSYNQALGHYKSKMRLDTFRRQVTSSENFARGRFYSLNARMKKFETLVNYLTLEPIDFKNRIYDMVTNEVRRRSEFYETAPVKASVEKQLAEEKELNYQRSVKGLLERFSENNKSISGRIAKVFLNHPKTLNAISLESIRRTMLLGGGTWSSDGSISVLYTDSNGLKHTLLHELTHHFTVPYMHLFYEKEMYDKSWYKKNPERLQELDSEADAPGKYLFRELSEQEIANLKKIDAIYRHVVDLHKSGRIQFDNRGFSGNAEYGLTNAMEFMAEVISNPYFAAKIAEQPSIYNKQSNLLKDIIDAIFSMFGIVKDGNLLNDVYSVFEETFLGKDDKYTFGDNLKKDAQVETVDAYQQMFQLEETSMTAASPEILSKVKDILKKMGVNVESLADYAKKSSINVSGVNAVADLVRGVIAVAEGKEDVALTEEMVHIATAIIEQKNPTLVTEMIAKIDRFKIYKQTLEQYKDNKYYQLPNGKPDIRKIKKEAVDRLIAELIVNGGNDSLQFPELQQEENVSLITRWWNAITDFFRGMYKSANIDIFQETATQIMEGGVEGQVSDVVSDEVFFQVAEPTKAQKDVQTRILETRDSVRNAAQDASIDLLTLGDPDASNFYERKQPDGTWKEVTKRVTDRVKRWYKNKFGELQFTKEEKEFNEFKRNLGVKYHGYFKEIHDRYFNSDGTRRQKTEPRRDIRDKVDADIYSKLETYYVNLIDSRSKDGKKPLVFSEVKIYDPIEKEAGSIDLLIIDEDGTANIVDWKFMTIAQGQKDVQWYKQEAYGVQLARYRDILLSGYGVKKVSMNRAIPILFEIKPPAKNVADAKPLLTGINIGSANPMEIEDLRLLPVSEKTESTGYENLDNFLAQLNAVLDKIAKKKATTDVEKEFKKERLNVLREAIRIAQGTLNITPVIDVLMVMKKEGDQLINDYNAIYKNADPRSNEFTNNQISEFSSDLRDYISIAEVFGRISDKIGDLIYNESMDKMGLSEEDLASRKEVLANLRDQSENIRKSRDVVFDIAGKFADKYMGLRNLISGLMSPEAVVKGLGALFRSVRDIPLRSVKILNKLVENARLKASKDAMGDVNKLMEIRQKLADRGGDLRKLVQQIYQKDDKGKLVNKLIYRYSQEFFDGIKNNALEGQRNIKWIRENVDVEAYLKEVVPLMEKRIAQIKKDYADNDDMQERLVEQTVNKWDIRRPGFNGWDNYILMRHPLSKWESKEYLELKKDADLFELYQFISGVNEKAKEARYLQDKATSAFLPWVRKSMAESLAWDFSLSTVMNFGNRLSIKADEVGRGKIDALTKEIENGIPKYYAADFTSFPDSDLTMADVSEDLFANMILYINDMNKYKYLSEVEGQLELIKTLEKFKEHHLETSKNGQVVIKNGVPNKEEGNEENFKIYDQFMRAVLYDQKYPLDDTDVTMSTSVGSYMKKAVNSVSTHFGGKEVFEVSDNPDSISLVKSIETMNRFFQLKALGLEFVSGAVNWFGTNVQLAAQSGTYFNSTEVLKKQYQILGNKMNEEKRNLFIEFINEFMPLREDPNYENLQKAGMSELTRKNFGDFLMFFMRAPEQFTEKAVFMTLLDNIIVQDGRFENIRKVVRQKYAAERATASSIRLKEIDKEIERDIQELKKQSVGNIAKVENGKLIIPGFDMSNRDEINRLTSLTRNVSTAATGGIDQQNTNRAQMNIWIKSAMVFKNWIPGLAFTRFDHLRKVSDDFSVTINEDGTTEGERYDIGRLRLFFYVAGTSIVQMSNNINNLLTLNEKGLAEFDRMYTKFAEEYYLREGEPLTMTREEFIDLIRTNLRNQMNELALTLGLVSTSFSMGLIGPDDDDTKAEKNAFRYSQRVINKFVSELTFFINPFEFQNILEGNLLPAIGVVTDVSRFFTHLTMEVTGFDISDPEKSFEDVQKSAQPIKNLAKMFPVSKSLINYLAMIDEEFAKEFDITIQKESSR
jgi:hypothetical protein